MRMTWYNERVVLWRASVTNWWWISADALTEETVTRTPRNSVFNEVNAYARLIGLWTHCIFNTLRTSHALYARSNARSTRTLYSFSQARSTRAIYTFHERNQYKTLLCRLPSWEIFHLFLFQNFKLDSIEVWRQSTNSPGCIFELEFRPNGTSWKRDPCEVCYCEV